MNRKEGLSIDSSEWELSKENVQPIKQGRKIPNLMAALAPTGEDAHRKLQKDKQNFEAEIRTCDGDDCLDVWYRYILWTEENVPKGGPEITTLLERCIKEFKDVDKYKCDERYLQVWIKYADCCEDSLEIFNYMHSQGISSSLAYFYIAWSSACENVQDFQKADEVLLLGIERNVQPLETLEKYHVGFQRRLTTHIATAQDLCPSESLESGRNALALLKTSGKKKLVGIMRSSSVHKPQSGIIFGNSKNSGLSFSVLHDSDNKNHFSRLPAPRGDWKEPPAQSAMTKENVSLPGKWTKHKPESRSIQTIPLVRAACKQNFQVHVEVNAEQNVSGPIQTIGNQVLAVRKPEAESSKNPLNVIAKENKDIGQVYFRLMYDKRKVYAGTEEFQFEETRAAMYSALRAQEHPLPKDVNRLKRKRDAAKTVVEQKERCVYQKDKIYALEGEFQPEEIMARHFDQGKRLRLKKIHSLDRTSVNSKDSVMSKECIADENSLFVPKSGSRKSVKNLSFGCSYRSANSTDSTATETYQTNDVNSFTVGDNLCPPLEDRSSLDLNSCPPKSKVASEFTGKENREFGLHSENGNDENACCQCILNGDVKRQALDEVSASASSTPNFNPVDNSIGSTSLTEPFGESRQLKREKLTSSLIGPSPTLTTKQAFAEVMPWFKTTVGMDNSDDDSDADFKNDHNPEENLDLFGVAFGGEFDVLGVKRDPNSVYHFPDEDQENLPPVGYSQPLTERPMIGSLQPSANIPVESFEEQNKSGVENDGNNPGTMLENCVAVKSDSSLIPVQYKKIKDHSNDDDMTNFRGLNHSQFTAAARLASTPFEEWTDHTPLPTLHCSTIHPSDVAVVSADNKAKSRSSVEPEYCSANVPGSSFNTPSKVLSPILECSDEDAKISLCGASTQSSEKSKTNVVSQCVTQSEPFVVDDTSLTEGNDYERSVDITVPSAEGDVLNIVNPFDPTVCSKLLSQLSKQVSSYPGYHDLKKRVMTKISTQKVIDLDEDVYKICKRVGSGSFAKVFTVQKVDFGDLNEEDQLNPATFALKIQTPANEWEFYICSELLKRLKSQGKSAEELSTFVKVEDFYVFSDGSCLVTEFHKNGTFLDMINYFKKTSCLDEGVAVYFAVEMMKILECIHECGIIHGDIKPDNLVLIEGNNSENVEGRGLALIDFGCAIDVTLFPPGTRFTVKKNTESFECIEMKTGRPWITQVDTYGLLGSLHCLIFGEYMKVYTDPRNGRWRPIKSVKRTWNRDLWSKLYDLFLNIPSCDDLPSIGAIRKEFQEYLDKKLKQRLSMHKKMMKY